MTEVLQPSSASAFDAALGRRDTANGVLGGIDALLATPVLFKEARHPDSKGLGIPTGYKAVNEPPKKKEGEARGMKTPNGTAPSSSSSSAVASSSGAPASSPATAPTSPSASAPTTLAARPTLKASRDNLYPWLIPNRFPNGVTRVGKGLHNLGNTCYLNSALQCLLHTPALIYFLVSPHAKGRTDGKFCMIQALKLVAKSSFTGSGSSFAPRPITNNLRQIARHLHIGRQEDSQEFLRYAVDALQCSFLSNHPPKLPHAATLTSPIHKIFGGKLRSRVLCMSCKTPSDTFDAFLDLSVGVKNCGSLQDALKGFVALDRLEKDNKYNCEKCKKRVNATKQFTVHEAPQCLTIHLKRFGPTGGKLGHRVVYNEKLDLKPYMSADQPGARYRLYGVVCHAGSGARSGHYIAHVRAADGHWYTMNDDMVSPTGPPLSIGNAYILFYEREKGSVLEEALAGDKVLGKRKAEAPAEDDDEDASSDEGEDDAPPATTSFSSPGVFQNRLSFKHPSAPSPAHSTPGGPIGGKHNVFNSHRPQKIATPGYGQSSKKQKKRHGGGGGFGMTVGRDTLRGDDMGVPVQRPVPAGGFYGKGNGYKPGKVKKMKRF